ncbi:F-box protein [Spatholobus suberectus]|nr:F-box protein [Spatholobus suberectus]
MMEKAAKKAMMMVDHNKEEPTDFFAPVPDKVLWSILSLLPIDEAVRTSILSKRWRSMWKHTTHLDLDVKHMIYPLGRLTTSPSAHLDFILNLDKEKRIYRYNILCFRLLKEHFGDLTTCRFAHFPFNDVTACLSVLLEQEKGLKDLTLECKSIDTMSKPIFPIKFNGCNRPSSLKSLELVRYSLKCPSSFEAVFKNLRTLKLIEIQMGDGIIGGILRSCISLENFTLLQSSGFTTIEIKSSSLKFLELNFLCVNHIEISVMSLEVLVLASLNCPAKNLVLGAPNLSEFHCYSNQQISTSSHVLKTHELLEHWIGLLVDKCSKFKIHGVAISALPHPRSTFWKGREICHCVSRKLNAVHIEGFTGKDLEVDFIKYLIARSTRMKKITIICDSSLDEANELLSIKNASAKLFIELMVAKRALFNHCVAAIAVVSPTVFWLLRLLCLSVGAVVVGSGRDCGSVLFRQGLVVGVVVNVWERGVGGFGISVPRLRRIMVALLLAWGFNRIEMEVQWVLMVVWVGLDIHH